MLSFLCTGLALIIASLLSSPISASRLITPANRLSEWISLYGGAEHYSSLLEQVIEKMPIKFNRQSDKKHRDTWLRIEQLESRYFFSVSPLTAGLTSGAILAGDYSQNGVVDAADFVTWRKALDTAAALPNDLSPGTVSATDVNIWRTSFGQALDSNWAPLVTAGPNLTAASSGATQLLGEVIINNPLNATINWSQVAGPGVASFIDVNSASTSVTFSDPGVYELQLSATNHGVVTSDMVTVTVPSVTVAPPELPRELLNTTLDPTYNRPANILVHAGQSLQAALNSAQPGDIIELDAGATFTGNYVLPNKSGNEWIYIRTSAYASLPAPGTRVTPAQANLMAKLLTSNSDPVITAADGAHNYRFIGIEITTSNATNSNLVSLGSYATSLNQLPHHITFDRTYIHGTPTSETRRGIAMNSTHTAVIDSYLSNFHQTGSDSQAIAVWNGPGPFKIVNNFLEAAGENILFGGSDPTIDQLVPSDIEIRGNNFYKPLTWKIDDPSYAGTPWLVKNLFEIKMAQRVLLDGNVFENNWPSGQDGYAILMKPNHDGNAPWTRAEDITFTNNIVRNTASGIKLANTDPEGKPSNNMERVLIKNNLVTVDTAKFGGNGTLLSFVSMGRESARDIAIEHNTLLQIGQGGSMIIIGDQSNFADHLIYRDNIATNGANGVKGPGAASGTATLNAFLTNYIFTSNVLVGAPNIYPTGNLLPANTAAIRFTDEANANYRLAMDSPYKNAATDGKDIGADIDAIMSAIAATATGFGTSSIEFFNSEPMLIAIPTSNASSSVSSIVMPADNSVVSHRPRSHALAAVRKNIAPSVADVGEMLKQTRKGLDLQAVTKECDFTPKSGGHESDIIAAARVGASVVDSNVVDLLFANYSSSLA